MRYCKWRATRTRAAAWCCRSGLPCVPIAPGGSSLAGVPLSDREVDVLRLVAEGMSNTEVGAELFISGQTVKTHMERICSKLGVSGRAAAVKRGMETGALARPDRAFSSVRPGPGVRR